MRARVLFDGNTGGWSDQVPGRTLDQPPPTSYEVQEFPGEAGVETARLIRIKSATDTLNFGLYYGPNGGDTIEYSGISWDTTKLLSIEPGPIDDTIEGPSVSVSTIPNVVESWKEDPGPLEATVVLLSRAVGDLGWLELLRVEGRMSGLTRQRDQSYSFEVIPEASSQLFVSDEVYSNESHQIRFPGDTAFDKVGIGFTVFWPPDPLNGGTGIGLTTDSTQVTPGGPDDVPDDGSGGVDPNDPDGVPIP